MAKHVVEYSLPKNIPLGKADVEFVATDPEGRVLGRILVSRGGIDLVPRHGRKKGFRTITWTELFKM